MSFINWDYALFPKRNYSSNYLPKYPVIKYAREDGRKKSTLNNKLRGQPMYWQLTFFSY